jgi:hypothetical protein
MAGHTSGVTLPPVPFQNMLLQWPDRDPELASIDVPFSFQPGDEFEQGGMIWQAVGLMNALEAGFVRALSDQLAYVCKPVRAAPPNDAA